MRKPKIENKYNLTMKDVKNLKLIDREKMEEMFWRNDVIDAYCLLASTAKSGKDMRYGTYNEYWIGVYDKDNKVEVSFEAYGGMCSYNFNEFYNKKDIENEIDLEIQEMFMERINQLIDDGIFEITGR